MPAAPTRRYRLTRDQRLRGQSAFKHVFDANIRRQQGPLTVMGVPNSLARLRFGISIGKRVGHSPKRNRIKRRLRAAARACGEMFQPQHDYVLVGRREALSAPFAKVVSDLSSAIAKVHAIPRDAGT